MEFEEWRKSKGQSSNQWSLCFASMGKCGEELKMKKEKERVGFWAKQIFGHSRNKRSCQKAAEAQKKMD